MKPDIKLAFCQLVGLFPIKMLFTLSSNHKLCFDKSNHIDITFNMLFCGALLISLSFGRSVRIENLDQTTFGTKIIFGRPVRIDMPELITFLAKIIGRSVKISYLSQPPFQLYIPCRINV